MSLGLVVGLRAGLEVGLGVVVGDGIKTGKDGEDAINKSFFR